MTKETKQTKEWIDCLFNSGEYTCMGHKFENKTFPVSKIAESQEYVSINPMKKGTTRSYKNVTRFSNFLFEMDHFSKRDQAEIMKKCGLPFSTIVDSSNKSLHFIVALDHDLGDRTMYTAYFKAMKTVVEKFGGKIDEACKDPGRFTRSPYGVNTKLELSEKRPNIHDRIQKVKWIGARTSLKLLDEWLSKNDVDPLDFIQVPTVRTDYVGVHSQADADLKWDWIIKYFMKDDVYEDGNKHNYQIKMVYCLLRAGLTGDEVDTLLMSKFGEVSTGIKSANNFEADGDPIYVPTMEERREYYKAQDESEALERKRRGYDRDDIPKTEIEFRPEEIDRYLAVGIEYFKIDSVTDELIPWTKTMFEKLYGGRSTPPLLYDKFGYKPDYTSEQFPNNLGADGKTRNRFIRPDWQATPGKWDTIETGLRHGFGDQYDMALQYCAISILYPEAKLPAILFVGGEESGKTSVIQILISLIGKQAYKKIGGKQLESDFTDFLAESQLVVVEESGNWKNPEAVMDNLKDWITENGQQTVNPKYGKQYKSPIHSKFVFSSNNYDALHLSGKATRFWVREMDTAPTTKISQYKEKVEAEMGHFAHYLLTYVAPELRLDKDGNLDTSHSRLYFAPEDYVTKIKGFMQDLSNSELYEQILDSICKHFEIHEDQDKCFADLDSIKDQLGLGKKGMPNNKEIKMCMKNEFKKDRSTTITRPDSLRFDPKYPKILEKQPTRRGNWWIFDRETVMDIF